MAQIKSPRGKSRGIRDRNPKQQRSKLRGVAIPRKRDKPAATKTAKPVGLLWDSVSNNVGDRAIGMVMRRFLEREGIPFAAADPFSYDPAEYSMLIVGGGELIRPRGDPFYDRFRVRGAHILNAAGIHEPDDVEYLNEYRLVSVRSRAEKNILDPSVKDVKVRPCVTLAMGDLFESTNNPLVAQTVPDGDTVGVHLNLAINHLIPGILPILRELRKRYPLVLLPFTLYQQDRRILEAMRRWLPDVPVSPLEDPADIFHAIGRMRALVCVSLHGLLFAYAQNVPVLAYPTVPKISYFLEERGLEGCQFRTPGELESRLETVLAAPPDFSAAFARDRKTVRDHLAEIAEIVRTPSPAPRAVHAPESALRQSLAGAVQSFHTRWMEYLTLWSHNFAEGLETQYAFLQKEEHVRSLEAQVAGWKSETETRDRAVQELTLKGRRDDAAIQALTARAAEKDKALGGLISQAAEKDEQIRILSVQAAEREQSLRTLRGRLEETERALRDLSAEATAKDRTVQALTLHLAEIKGSTAWSIVRFLWRVRLFLLPHGSRREWIGAMTLRSLRVLRNEGVSAFLRKAGEKIRNPRDSTS